MAGQMTAERNADDKKEGMTLADLQEFIDDCYRLNLPIATRVTAYVGWKAQLQRVVATGKKDS